MGARKADLIAPTHAEFDRSRVARSNLTYRIADVDHDDPTVEQLRSMTEGDLVLLRPGASKADQVGILHGDKPVALPYHADDPLNAAFALTQLEIAAPVHGPERKTTPAFTVSPDLKSISHGVADRMFRALATHALGSAVAECLSLHSGRSWKATAVWGVTRSLPTIQAACRWASAESAQIYARMTLREHADLIDSAMRVRITPALRQEFRGLACPLDADDAIAALHSRIDRLDRLLPAAPADSPRAFRADVGAADVLEPDGPEPDDDDGLPIDDRPLADAETLTPGSPVAVPFKNRTHGERFYLGHLVKIANKPHTPTTALVRFPEVEGPPSQYLVDHDRLFIPNFDSPDPEP